jgi:hypothetical protein
VKVLGLEEREIGGTGQGPALEMRRRGRGSKEGQGDNHRQSDSGPYGRRCATVGRELVAAARHKNHPVQTSRCHGCQGHMLGRGQPSSSNAMAVHMDNIMLIGNVSISQGVSSLLLFLRSFLSVYSNTSWSPSSDQRPRRAPLDAMCHESRTPGPALSAAQASCCRCSSIGIWRRKI